MDYNTASKTLAFSKVKFTKAFVNDHINKDWPIDKIGYYSTTSNEIPSITAKSIERGKVDDIYNRFVFEYTAICECRFVIYIRISFSKRTPIYFVLRYIV